MKPIKTKAGALCPAHPHRLGKHAMPPYELKAGEEVRGGRLFGWTGAACPKCNGTGEASGLNPYTRACVSCAGTGEEWGAMPLQPPNLPTDTGQDP